MIYPINNDWRRRLFMSGINFSDRYSLELNKDYSDIYYKNICCPTVWCMPQPGLDIIERDEEIYSRTKALIVASTALGFLCAPLYCTSGISNNIGCRVWNHFVSTGIFTVRASYTVSAAGYQYFVLSDGSAAIITLKDGLLSSIKTAVIVHAVISTICTICSFVGIGLYGLYCSDERNNEDLNSLCLNAWLAPCQLEAGLTFIMCFPVTNRYSRQGIRYMGEKISSAQSGPISSIKNKCKGIFSCCFANTAEVNVIGDDHGDPAPAPAPPPAPAPVPPPAFNIVQVPAPAAPAGMFVINMPAPAPASSAGETFAYSV